MINSYFFNRTTLLCSGCWCTLLIIINYPFVSWIFLGVFPVCTFLSYCGSTVGNDALLKKWMGNDVRGFF